MSGRVGDRRRLIRITAGNLRHNHIYITGHHDFFPPECIGAATKKRNAKARPIQVVLDGMDTTIETDIGTDARTGKPRRMFRGRKWVSLSND